MMPIRTITIGSKACIFITFTICCNFKSSKFWGCCINPVFW